MTTVMLLVVHTIAALANFKALLICVTLDIIYWNQINHSLSNHHIRYQLTSFFLL